MDSFCAGNQSYPSIPGVVKRFGSLVLCSQVPWYHLLVEAVLAFLIIWLWFTKSYSLSRDNEKLSEKEKEALIKEWIPEPLVHTTRKLRSEPRLITGQCGPRMTINEEEYLNLTSLNFIDLIGRTDVMEAAIEGVRKYGVGSCGPRGFYGTMDVHNTFEERIAKFMGREEAVLYSFLFATVSSAIPSYAKRGDVIFYDKAVSFPNQRGLIASRSQLRPFEHNDMKDLEQLLQKQENFDELNPKLAKITRRFVVVEGLYYNTGTIVPLQKLIELKYKYKFRILLDESYSFGVLGSSGKGVSEHFGLPAEDIDLISASLEHSVAACGGFCCGDSFVVDHQRLSGLGYCFSASLPPLFVKAAMVALDYMDSKPQVFHQLQSNCRLFRKEIERISGLIVAGDVVSPIIHFKLKNPSSSRADDEDKLENIVRTLEKDHKIIVTTAKYLEDDELHLPPPSMRIAITSGLTEAEIKRCAHAVKAVAKKIFAK